MTDRIDIPEQPKQGDVVTWWMVTHHPGGAYVMRERATYYADAECKDVLGEDHARGKPFHDQWYCEAWYEPSGSRTAGGRNSTAGLREWLEQQRERVYPTWAAARDAAIAAIQGAVRGHKMTAARLELAAMELAGSPPPPETR